MAEDKADKQTDGKQAEGKTDGTGEDKPAKSSRKKTTTIPMHQPGTEKTWEATSVAEAAEMTSRGWRQDDPQQNIDDVPSGWASPGRGTPTGGDPVTVVAD